jgi:mono/diheme cytochrome c family protein
MRSDLASVTTYCHVAALLAAAWLAGLPPVSAADGASYQIIDGKVDRQTYNGYRRYNASCNHCHGPDGAGGSFGPSLIDSPPAYDAFVAAVLYGRGHEGICR